MMSPAGYPEELSRAPSAGEEKEEFMRKARLVRWIALAFMALFVVLLALLVNSGSSSFPSWSVIVWMEFVVWCLGIVINLFLVLSVIPGFTRRMMSDDSGPSTLFLHHMHQQSLIAILLGGVLPGFLLFLIWRQVAGAKPAEPSATGTDGPPPLGAPTGAPMGTWSPTSGPQYPGSQPQPAPIAHSAVPPVDAAPAPVGSYPPPQTMLPPTASASPPPQQYAAQPQYAPSPSPPPASFGSPVVQPPQAPPSLPPSSQNNPPMDRSGFAPPRRICPSCGNPVDAQQRVCLACGRSLL